MRVALEVPWERQAMAYLLEGFVVGGFFLGDSYDAFVVGFFFGCVCVWLE